MATMSTTLRESLLVLSDVHLGSDLNDLTGGHMRRPPAIDRDLVELIAHYGRTPPTGERWRLVFAGDFIDFLGMIITAPSQRLATAPTDEERAHGLGNAEDHAREKLRRVVDRHGEVFAALGAFVDAGNALTFVHGNHDLELHWDLVRQELFDVLFAHAGPTATREDFAARIEHRPWFYYVGGVVYVEHGHQYDAFCATEHVMVPLSPLDPRRLARGFCDVLLRHVVRPTRGLSEHGHEHLGVPQYAAFAVKQGLGGMFRLLGRFVRAILALFKLRREHLSEAAKGLRAEHERRLGLLAEAGRIGIDRLRALIALQTPPLTRSIRGILASLLLDRIALGLGASLTLLVLAVVGLRASHFGFSAALVLAAWLVAHRYLASQRSVSPHEMLQRRALDLVRLFPAAFVVMGHTHVPVKAPVGEGSATYVNLGGWSEEELESTLTEPATRTHLVIHPADAGPSGELLRWHPLRGPERFLLEPPLPG